MSLYVTPPRHEALSHQLCSTEPPDTFFALSDSRSPRRWARSAVSSARSRSTTRARSPGRSCRSRPRRWRGRAKVTTGTDWYRWQRTKPSTRGGPDRPIGRDRRARRGAGRGDRIGRQRTRRTHQRRRPLTGVQEPTARELFLASGAGKRVLSGCGPRPTPAPGAVCPASNCANTLTGSICLSVSRTGRGLASTETEAIRVGTTRMEADETSAGGAHVNGPHHGASLLPRGSSRFSRWSDWACRTPASQHRWSSPRRPPDTTSATSSRPGSVVRLHHQPAPRRGGGPPGLTQRVFEVVYAVDRGRRRSKS